MAARIQHDAIRARAWLAAWLVLGALGCESGAEIHGQLVISVETDMALPDELDNMRVQVLVRGQTQHDRDYLLGGGAQDTQLPATLTLIAGEDPSQAVTVRVAGSRGGEFRTFREITTTVPHGRLSHVRMPLQWLCDQTVEKVSSDPFSRALRSTCGADHSCVAGHCVPSQVDASKLPDFAARNVYGRADRPEDGRCFDTLPCMITGHIVQPDADCTVEIPQRSNLNVALRVPRGGICDDSFTTCFVPLDGDSDEGWKATSDQSRLLLPHAVCEKLGDRAITAVYMSTQCPTKTAADPPCGPWSSVTTKGEQPPASALSRAPKVELIAELDPETVGAVCCPLLLDRTDLYTCTCPSQSEARVMRIDLQDGSKVEAFRFHPPAERDRRSFGATLADGAFFWVVDRLIERVSLDGMKSKTLMLNAGTYDQSPLLSDESTLMVLGNRPEGKAGSPVQVLRVTYADVVTPLEAGGNQVVYQFAQSSDAIYVATDQDEQADGSIARTSTIVRIDKLSGTRTQLVPNEQLMTPKIGQGGYLGVQMGTNTLYALFESAPDQEGKTSVQLRAIDASRSASMTYDTIDAQPIDPSRTRVSLLGVVGNTPILARTEYESSTGDSAVVRSSSMYAVAAPAEPPLILADLKETSLQGLVSDDQRAYVLTTGGALFGIARTGLP